MEDVKDNGGHRILYAEEKKDDNRFLFGKKQFKKTEEHHSLSTEREGYH